MIDTASDADAMLSEFLPGIARNRGVLQEELDIPEMKEMIKTGKWIRRMHAKTSKCRWNVFQQAQQFWDPHINERVCGGCFWACFKVGT